jgi:bifunctional enzyme CysN/CysC
VLAINKMDLVGFSRERWQEIADAFAAAARPLGFRSIVPVPICARDGDNVAVRSARMPWYDGPVLLDHLEAIDVAPPSAAPNPFRLPVQIVLRPDAEFRGYAGTVGGGTVRAGDAAVALPSGKRTMVARIVTADGDKAEASAGEAVTLTLADEIDVARGDVLAAADDPPQASDRLRAMLLWMAEDSLLTGRDYVLQIGPASANARVARIRHAVDIESYAPRPATWLGLNEIGLADLELDRPLAAAPYRQDEALGALVLVDRLSHETVAMGVIEAVGVDAERGGRWARRLQPRRFAPALLGGAAMFLLALLLSRDVALAGTLGCANLLISLAFGGLVNASK